MMLANTVENLFGGHALSGFGGGETVNNVHQSAPDPAGAPAADALLDQNRGGAQDVGYDDGARTPASTAAVSTPERPTQESAVRGRRSGRRQITITFAPTRTRS
jgi:hypothetical protein